MSSTWNVDHVNSETNTVYMTFGNGMPNELPTKLNRIVNEENGAVSYENIYDKGFTSCKQTVTYKGLIFTIELESLVWQSTKNHVEILCLLRIRHGTSNWTYTKLNNLKESSYTWINSKDTGITPASDYWKHVYFNGYTDSSIYSLDITQFKNVAITAFYEWAASNELTKYIKTCGVVDKDNITSVHTPTGSYDKFYLRTRFVTRSIVNSQQTVAYITEYSAGNTSYDKTFSTKLITYNLNNSDNINDSLTTLANDQLDELKTYLNKTQDLSVTLGDSKTISAYPSSGTGSKYVNVTYDAPEDEENAYWLTDEYGRKVYVIPTDERKDDPNNYLAVLLHFDESITKDEAGNVWTVNGTANAPAVNDTCAKFGNALQLTQPNQYLALQGGITLGGNDFTIEGWFNLKAETGYHSCLWSFWTSPNSTEQAFSIHRLRSEDKLALSIEGQSNIDCGAFTWNEWHHVAMVYNHSKQATTVYVDGNKKLTYKLKLNRHHYTNVWLGKDNNNLDSHTLGSVDEFRISDGVARWTTTDFVRPTVAYNTSAKTGLLMDYPFSIDLTNQADSGVNFNVLAENAKIGDEGSYEGGLISCTDQMFDLNKNWQISFEYKHVSSIAEWNHIFAFGGHRNHSGSDSAMYAIGFVSLKPDCVSLTENLIQDDNNWHSYIIEYNNDTKLTTVTRDSNVISRTKIVYPDSVKGLYISGGGSYKSIQCMLRNFQFYGTSRTDSYTKALLHFDDSVVKDECYNDWISPGYPSLANSNTHFWKGLQLNDGGYISLETGIALGGKDFTIDCWTYMHASTKENGTLFELNVNGEEDRISVSRNGIGTGLKVFATGVANVNELIATNLLNRLFHIALCYKHEDKTLHCFINGRLQDSYTFELERTTFNYMWIGKGKFNGHQYVGTIDEFRILDGSANWISDFEVPTEPYK